MMRKLKEFLFDLWIAVTMVAAIVITVELTVFADESRALFERWAKATYCDCAQKK